ncbi:hypothetical protein F4809DRAFT_643573 [Biscogniauxia mediterranea]|nr:hypothetical protein F4809DRAFT_643573 [Biscogniauxia mediterranea]
MNPEGASTNSSSAGPATPTNSRKERGAIAAQASGTVYLGRTHGGVFVKHAARSSPAQTILRDSLITDSRCCSLECKYREPQPTKKDKTLVEILERLKSLEGGLRSLDGKVDSLNVRGAFPLSIYGPLHQSSHGSLDSGRSSSWPFSNVHISGPTIPSSSAREVQYISATHKILSWPFIQQLLENTPHKDPELDLSALEKDGGATMLGSQGRVTPLSANPYNAPMMGGEHSSLHTQVSSTGQVETVPTSILNMGWENMQRLSKAYFNTFNLLYPIMDRQYFQSETLPTVANRGFDESSMSTLACLVFALGEIAIGGVQGAPIETRKGRPSGIKGGTADHPPGLLLFNEARKRMGFNLTECSLENVQIFSLAAIYYEACCHHAVCSMSPHGSYRNRAPLISSTVGVLANDDFGVSSMPSSVDKVRLIDTVAESETDWLDSNPEELTTHRGDLIRRAFWHCSIMETCLHLELNLPLTGLDKLEEMVGLPDFSGSFTEEDYVANQASHFQEHFASQIVLRRLSVEFHTTLSNAFGSPPTHLSPISRVEPPITSAASMTKQLTAQLDQWRGLLPVYLRWHEEHPGAFSHLSQEMYDQSLYPTPLPDLHTNYMFTADLDAPSVSYPYAVDIQTAMLRSRYYYVKYLMYRPFIFKALHHPEQMTQDDAEGVTECLKAILKWPITMSPTCFQKRLVPCLFFWSQNLLGILIILHLTQQVPILIRIRTTMMGNRFDQDASETVMLCINWIRDLKDIDPTAMRCWMILKGIYPLGDDT